MSIVDILKKDSTARIISSGVWLTWNEDDKCFEIRSRKFDANRARFEAACVTEEAAAECFLKITTGEESEATND